MSRYQNLERADPKLPSQVQKLDLLFTQAKLGDTEEYLNLSYLVMPKIFKLLSKVKVNYGKKQSDSGA